VTTHTPVQRFYCKSRLATEIEGAINRSIVQRDEQLLALAETKGNIRQATLVATDRQRSVLQTIASNESQSFAYSPYGHRPNGGGLVSLVGFNGERADPVTGHYLLGNGYRAFNPILMRFNSPDSWSPFKQGGINPYTYCLGDPINMIDPNGRAGFFNMISKLFQRTRNSTIPGVVHRSSGHSIAFHTSTRTTFTEVETLKSKLTPMTNTSNIQAIYTTQRVYPTTSTGTPDLTHPVITSTTMWKITPKHPTLLGIAHSAISDFKLLEPISFDSRHSFTNFHNFLERTKSDKALKFHQKLSDYGKIDMYNNALSEGQAGKLKGVNPISIADLSPATTLGEYFDIRLEIIRRIG
jgi:RHS repeat-associated protein